MPQTDCFASGLFQGRTAIVTGGGSGIGLAIASLLGRLGGRVVLAGRTEARLRAATGQLTDAGVDAHFRVLNIRDPNHVDAVFADLEHCFGVPDFLVNNAGGQFPARAEDISSNGFRAVFDLNVQGNWHMTRRFARTLLAQDRAGRIINIVFSHDGAMPWFAHAQAARAAILNLTRTLALEWGSRGILVNAIGPGPIDTEAASGYRADRGWEAQASRLPARRLGQPADVAHAAAFLLSPAASFITGILLPVDGGEALVGPNLQGMS